MTNYDINELYNFLFGYRGVPFPFGENLSYQLFESRSSGLINLKNMFNLPDNGDMNKSELEGKLKYSNITGVKYFMPTTLYAADGEYEMPNEPTFSLSLQKTVIQTPLIGNNNRGTVKEIVNYEDWQIDIRGIILNEKDDKYPYEEVEKLYKIFNYNSIDGIDNPMVKSLRIKNEMMNWLGIKYILLKSLSFESMVGIQNAQGYVIKAVSDSEKELEIKK